MLYIVLYIIFCYL